MKNMVKLLISDTLLTMDRVKIMFDSNNIYDSIDLVDSVVENLQVIFENTKVVCDNKEFKVCIKVLVKQLDLYLSISEEAPNIEDLVILVDALKEVCMKYYVI